MSRTTQMYLLFDYWPADDQTRWKAAFKTGDLFDESGLGAHLAESTRKMRRESYGRFLGFISASHPDLLSSQAHERVNRTILPEYATGDGGPAESSRFPSISTSFGARRN